MSDDEDVFLAHYGVKGMRWGRRTKTPGDISRAREKKRIKEYNRTKYTTKEIQAARSRQAARAEDYVSAVARAKRNPRTKKLILDSTIQNAMKTWQNQEDRYVAARKTRSEKFIAGALAGPIGLVIVSDRRTHVRAANSLPEKRSSL